MNSAIPRAIAGSIDSLRQYWLNRAVLLMAPSFNEEAQAVIAELTRFGANIAGIVSAAAVPENAFAVPHVFSCADQGLAVQPDEFDSWLENPPPILETWLEEVDPHRSWTPVGLTLNRVGNLFGRTGHGWRRSQWATWEDKTRIEEVWTEIGVPSPPHVVTAVDDSDVAKHVQDLDKGLGVVIAVDTDKYCFGAAQGIRWLRKLDEVDSVLDWARKRSNLIRIAEFVRGRPCTVLGMVLADGVAVFNPVEIVTLANLNSGLLEYCGTSSWWRPDPIQAHLMRGYARRVGTWLADSVGFRGIFSFDGVLTDNGFLATELNPRLSSGLRIRTGWPEFPLNLFQRAAQEALPGVFDLPSQIVETEFCRIDQDYPGQTVKFLSCDKSVPPGEYSAQVIVQGCEQSVRYQVEGDVVRLLSVDDLSKEGVIAPATAALAQALGRRELVDADDL